MDPLPQVFSALQQGSLPSFDILTLLLTRLAGYGITVFACFVKLPQILKVAKNRSAVGLSISAFELEVFICAIHISYGYITELPVSLYAETLAILVQCLILVSLIYYYAGVSPIRPMIAISLLVGWIAYVLSGAIDIRVVTSAFVVNQVLFLTSRILQITKTSKEKNVKQLSLGSYIPSTVGKFVRLLTSIKEGAVAYIGAHSLGFSMNFIMVLQILYYQFKTQQKKAA